MANVLLKASAAPTEKRVTLSEDGGIESVHFELTGRRVAVERNRDIVPRDRYDQTLLADGDQLEIVSLVGGG